MDTDRIDDGRAVPIMNCHGNGQIQLNTEAITQIFRHPDIQDKPVAIVSIAGAFRKGKSFMLNFFLRYLKCRGYENPCWLGSEHKLLKDGFEWKGGMDACTNGILIWSQIFTMKKDGEDIAVLLMDTQGLFDNKTDNKTNTIIFALSTLISSVQIFNLSQQIQENDLGFLQFFTAYAQAAKKESHDPNIKPFQSLIFLIRDWQYSYQVAYGMSGGNQYLQTVLDSDSKTSAELKSVRKHMRSSFDDIRCCLMPHPGNEVAQTMSFDGKVKDIDAAFVQHAIAFTEKIFKPDNLVVKKINGNVVNSLAILQYVVDCCNSLTDGSLPNPKTMMENVAEAQNFQAQKRCAENYSQHMKQVLGEKFVDDQILTDMHEQAMKAAIEEFYKLTRFGSEKSRRKHREHLIFTIEREYQMLCQLNKSNKIESASSVLTLIQTLADKYEDDMRKECEGSKILSEGELESLHVAFVTKVYDRFAEENVDQEQKSRYADKLENRIQRIYNSIKKDNHEKMKIAEEQNEKERNFLKLQLEYSMQYRDELRQMVDAYESESFIQHAGGQRRRDLVDKFKIKVLESGVSKGTNMWSKHVDGLEDKLSEELKEIIKISSEKRDNLDKQLEALQNQAYSAYDEYFAMILKNGYMETDELSAKHGKVVTQLLDDMRDSIATKVDTLPPLVAEYLKSTKQGLNEKYSTIQKWNEKNNGFFRKVFKVVKDYVIPALPAVLPFLARLLKIKL